MIKKEENLKGYKTVLKTTGLFGGVQIVTILTGIIKSKLVAIWLGATGLGVISLFTTSIGLISSITNLGLQQSAVRDISEAYGNNNTDLVLRKIKAINRWVLITGLIGTILTVILAPFLSEWLFSSNKYTYCFILLSIVVLLTGLYNGHYATFQGVRDLKSLARSNIYGAILAFIVSVPMLYFFKDAGIVWSIIFSTLAYTAVTYYYYNKTIKVVIIKQSYKETYYLGTSTVKLGIAMTINSVMVVFVQFILKTFITRSGSVDDNGLYQAGWTLNAQYLGMIFTAMAKDYFPTLSQHSQDNNYITQKVNEQAEISILLLGPMVLFMLVFLEPLICLFYSSDFLVIVTMTQWLLIGSIVKTGSWAISFIFLAKGDSKTFLTNEIGITVMTLPFYLLGYHYLGLVGIGYAFTLTYIIYFIWVAIVANSKYAIKYKNSFWKLFTVELLLSLMSFLLMLIFKGNKIVIWSGNLALLFFISYYSFNELNKRVNIMELIKMRKRNK